VVCGAIELSLVGQFTYFVLKEANFSGTWGCEVEEVLNEMEGLEQTTGWFWAGSGRGCVVAKEADHMPPSY